MSGLRRIPWWYWVLVSVFVIVATIWVSDVLYDWAPEWMPFVALLMVGATILGTVLMVLRLSNRGHFDVVPGADKTSPSDESAK